MTTKNRMFGKNILNSSKLLKVMSIILATCMLISLSACGGAGASQQDVQPTTQYATVDPVSDVPEDPAGEPDDGYWHEDPTEDPSVNEDPTTQPQTGAYTYNVYGVTISMDVNVDDYIYDNNGSKWFDLIPMIYDLGWAGADTYTEADWNNSDTTFVTWFTHRDGDIVSRIDLANYSEETLPGVTGHQFASIDLKYLADGGGMYYPVDDPDIMHRNTLCNFGKHYSDCEYRLSGISWYASYEDIVMITYIFWSAANNAGSNPMVSSFGTTNTDFVYAVDNRGIVYSLP